MTIRFTRPYLDYQSSLKFKLACDTNGVPEGALLSLLFFMKWSAAIAFNACIATQSKSHWRPNEEAVISYFGDVIYFLETVATSDLILETDADMIQSTGPSSKLPTEHGEAFWNKTLRCHRVYEQYLPNGVFIERLSESIRHSMHLH